MPIVGLTDQLPRFREIGTLRKGAAKPDRGPGRDLDYFRFDSDDANAVQTFASVYGSEPREIMVYLPFETLEQNFAAFQESWTGSQLLHRCDGEQCYSYDRMGRLVPDGRPCPDINKSEGDRNRCKQVGRLSVIVPALQRFAYVTVLTGSKHDIVAISQQLAAIASLRRGGLTGIPMIISRNEREISMPKPDGSRQRVKKWMLAIEVSPEWAAMELTSMEQTALHRLPDSNPPLLTGDFVDTETGEILSLPEPASVEQPQRVARPSRPITVEGQEAKREKMIDRIKNMRLTLGLHPEDEKQPLSQLSITELERIGLALKAQIND